jgi:hypothetical protein
VVNRQLVPPSRQCSSTFLALDWNFFLAKNQTPVVLRLLTLLISLPATSNCSQNSRDHWKESDFRQERTLWLQRQPRKHHSERCFLRMFPTLAAPLGDVCEFSRRLLSGWIHFQPSRYACLFLPPSWRSDTFLTALVSAFFLGYIPKFRGRSYEDVK